MTEGDLHPGHLDTFPVLISLLENISGIKLSLLIADSELRKSKEVCDVTSMAVELADRLPLKSVLRNFRLANRTAKRNSGPMTRLPLQKPDMIPEIFYLFFKEPNCIPSL